MHLQSLELKHFRNYSDVQVAFDDNVNVIIGANAQGKTNMLEAVYVLATSKSHRTFQDKNLIRWGQPFSRLRGRVQKKTGNVRLEVVISSRGKKVKRNEIEQRKLSDYIGTLNVVLFAPEDLNLVKGSPQVRRRFIDMEIGQINSVYVHDLSMFQRVLKQRNQLLKNIGAGVKKQGFDTMLDVLTEQLAAAGAKIIQRRLKFLELLETWARHIHRDITQGKETLGLDYIPTVHVSSDMDLSTINKIYREKLIATYDKDVERGMTIVGPHRDDLKIHINGWDVQTYGSQGQQRTAALSLKLAEIELIKETIGEYPVLLLDDVLSELDQFRQSHLLNAIQGKVQTFVTTTSVDGIEHETLRQATSFYVKDGRLLQAK